MHFCICTARHIMKIINFWFNWAQIMKTWLTAQRDKPIIWQFCGQLFVWFCFFIFPFYICIFFYSVVLAEIVILFIYMFGNIFIEFLKNVIFINIFLVHKSSQQFKREILYCKRSFFFWVTHYVIKFNGVNRFDFFCRCQ